MTDTTTGRGAELLDAVHAGDAAIRATWAEWDRLPRHADGSIDKTLRDEFWARLEHAQQTREAAASQCWGYFEGRRGRYTGPGEATAEEIAGWQLLQRRSWTAPVTPIMNRPLTVPREASDNGA
jgi:hypothetical protein